MVAESIYRAWESIMCMDEYLFSCVVLFFGKG